MDKKKIKRIIAREGLISIGTVASGLIIMLLGFSIEKQMDFVAGLGMCILWFGYPSYLIIRFTIWAVIALKEKE
jgi:hypothetical protein